MASVADRPDPAGARRTTEPDWPTQATDAVVRVVDSVRAKTTGPATSLARTVVYGVLAVLVGTAALVVGVIVAVRGVDVGVDELLSVADVGRDGRSTWISHVIVGLAFLAPGIWAWRKGWRASAG